MPDDIILPGGYVQDALPGERVAHDDPRRFPELKKIHDATRAQDHALVTEKLARLSDYITALNKAAAESQYNDRLQWEHSPCLRIVIYNAATSPEITTRLDATVYLKDVDRLIEALGHILATAKTTDVPPQSR